MAKDNQHFNPQGLLRGFTIQGERSLLWEYDKEIGEISRRPKSTSEICSQYYFYAQRDDYGSIDTVSIEDALQKIEDPAIRIIHNLSVVPGQKYIQLSDKDKGILSLFISMLWGRVPSLRDSAISFDQKILNETFKEVAHEQYEEGSMPDIIKELYEKGVLNRELFFKVDVQHIIHSTIVSACKNYMKIFEKIWTFCVPDSGMSFVTSDNPVCFSLPSQYHASTNFLVALYHPLSDIFVALKKDLAIRYIPKLQNYDRRRYFLEGKIFRFGTRDTKSANKFITRAARRYVYSGEKSDAFARMVGRLKGTEQRYYPESVSEIPIELSYDFRNTEANE